MESDRTVPQLRGVRRNKKRDEQLHPHHEDSPGRPFFGHTGETKGCVEFKGNKDKLSLIHIKKQAGQSKPVMHT